MRGRTVRGLVWSRPVLWYAVRQQPVLLVVVADPDARQTDDLFFTTDLGLAPNEVASLYAGRWSIEDTFRNAQATPGRRRPPVLEGPGTGAGGRSLAVDLLGGLAVVRVCHGAQAPWQPRPWHTGKRTPSFADALAALRRATWARRIFDGSDSRSQLAKFPDALIDALAEAA